MRATVVPSIVVLAALGVTRPAWAGAEEVPGLIRALVHGSPGESSRAISRLQFLGPSVAGPPLRLLLVSENEDERVAASDALASVHDLGAMSQLEHAVLVDEDWEVRRNAVQALGALHSRHPKHLLELKLHSDPQERVRKACVVALADIGGGGPALAQAAASDSDLEIRLEALDRLARAKDRSVAGRLRELLHDSSFFVRFAAARALAWQNDAAAKKFLTTAIASDDPEQVGKGVSALADVPASWAADLLARTLDGRDASNACNAAAALAKRKDDRGTQFLLKLAASEGPAQEQASSWLKAGTP
jgi:HEAT repeat protein